MGQLFFGVIRTSSYIMLWSHPKGFLLDGITVVDHQSPMVYALHCTVTRFCENHLHLSSAPSARSTVILAHASEFESYPPLLSSNFKREGTRSNGRENIPGNRFLPNKSLAEMPQRCVL